MARRDQHLFVYGTLRQALRHPLRRILRLGSEHLGEARFQGVLYAIDWYPGAVPSENPHDTVWGDLYRLNAPDMVLERLDAYERCTPADPQPTLFRRERLEVRCADGARCRAWIYLYNQPVTGLQRIASGDFLREDCTVSPQSGCARR